MRKAATDRKAVLGTYADIAQAMYEDSLTTARKSAGARSSALVAKPTEATLTAAREAWLAARVPYQQTEVYRFGNPIVDEWEGRVNSWPLDEGLIDYVDGGSTAAIATRTRSTPRMSSPIEPKIGGKTVDASNDHLAHCCAACRRSAASRPTSRPAITPSNSCCGARI